MDDTKIHFHDFLVPPFLSPPLTLNASNKFSMTSQCPLFSLILPTPTPQINSTHIFNNPTKPLCTFTNPSTLLHALPYDQKNDYYPWPSYSLHFLECFFNPKCWSLCGPLRLCFSIFTYLCEALRKPFPLAAEIPNELPSMEGCFTFEIMNSLLINMNRRYLHWSTS